MGNLEKTLESPVDCKESQPVHSKGDQSWVSFGRNDAKAETLASTLATSCEELTHWKRLWCWEGLGARGEGDDSGWDGWMASLTQWTWVWADSGSWWWTGRCGVLQSMGLQRVGHNWVTELNWTEAEGFLVACGPNPLIIINSQFHLVRSFSLPFSGTYCNGRVVGQELWYSESWLGAIVV